MKPSTVRLPGTRAQRLLFVTAMAGAGTAAAVSLGLARPYHFLVVEEGVLYRSGALDPGTLERVLEEHGIRCLVNLQPSSINALPWHAEEAAVCARLGVSMIDLPLEAEAPPTPAQLATWFAVLDDPANHPVIVHCQHGVVRTGALVALFQIGRRGVPNHEAWRALPDFGHDMQGPRRKPIRDFVLAFRPDGRAPR